MSTSPSASDRAVSNLQHELDESKLDSNRPQRHDSKISTAASDVTDDPQDAIISPTGNESLSVNKSPGDSDHVSTFPTPKASIAHRVPQHLLPARVGLQLRTNMDPLATEGATRTTGTPTISCASPDFSTDDMPHLQSATSPIPFPSMTSALRSNISTSSLASSASLGLNSSLPSPYLAAMTDLTPLPSPVMSSDIPAWRRIRPGTPSRSREGSINESSTPTITTSPSSPSRKKKGYSSLMQEASIANAASVAGAQDNTTPVPHTRNRSISEFVPGTLQNVRQRNVTIGSGDKPPLETTEYQMHREVNLAAQRGLSAPAPDLTQQFPTPPPSNASVAESDDADDETPYLEDGSVTEYLEIHCGIHNKRRKFRQLRQLGEGTFSKVMLATRERIPSHPTPEIEDILDPHKLVAVKVVMHGPAGGADEERIETSLRREVEMLKSISHPSLIHLKACEWQPTRTLLVLTYCPGGDMFELASQRRDLLMRANLVQRMFAELVSAVTYLHAQWIVHRDIKLENVLVNLSASALQSLEDPQTHPTPILTLTDLGLSRRIPQPPESPLLSTRCGSEDYAAPEILLGQPYDGRLTDGWALGVLLYALIEGRLPFDAPPNKPDRSRNTHRIARADWIWCRFGDEDGEWDPNAPAGKDFEGARPCVEGLLKKVRMGRKPLMEIAELPWVKEGIRVPGGLRMREEDEGDDLL